MLEIIRTQLYTNIIRTQLCRKWKTKKIRKSCYNKLEDQKEINNFPARYTKFNLIGRKKT